MTTYELTFGAADIEPQQTRRFTWDRMNDALTRFAAKVSAYDTDPAIHAAHVSLKRNDTDWGFAWTKTSDERPTVEGDTP